MKDRDTEVIHVRIEKKLLERVKALAQEQDRTYSNMLVVLVKKAIGVKK